MGQVAAEGAVADGQRRAAGAEQRQQGAAHDAAAEGVSVMCGAEAVASADGLVIAERGPVDCQAGVVDDRAAAADSGEGANAAVARLGQVPLEGAVFHARLP